MLWRYDTIPAFASDFHWTSARTMCLSLTMALHRSTISACHGWWTHEVSPPGYRTTFASPRPNWYLSQRQPPTSCPRMKVMSLALAYSFYRFFLLPLWRQLPITQLHFQLFNGSENDPQRRLPYNHISNGHAFNSVLLQRIQNGDRPRRARYTLMSDQQWQLLCQCWEGNPADRPHIQHILNVLQTFLFSPSMAR